MSSPGQITVKISAIADEFNKVMGGVSSKMTGLGKDFDLAALRLQTFSNNTTSAGKSMSMYLTLPIIGAGAAAVKASSDFETLQTSLKTILGSSEAAKNAMAWIEDFSAKTPYQMTEVADAFKKLSAYGFDATKVIGTLGDTASAMGKTLDQAVEMFADATTGEFERLKEFGVKARTEGDKVTFSYTENGQSLTKTVNKTSADISAGLTAIFAKYKGGMDEQSKTLNGSLSNMIDNITRLGRLFGDTLAPAVKSASDVIGSIAKELSSMDEGTRSWVVGIALTVAALGPLLIVIGKIVAGYRAFILIQAGATAAMEGHAVATGAAAAGSAIYTIAMKAAALATTLFNAAWAASPLGVVVLGIAALAGALYGLGRVMSDSGDKTKEAAKYQEDLNKALKGTLDVSSEVKDRLEGIAEATEKASKQENIESYKQMLQAAKTSSEAVYSSDKRRAEALQEVSFWTQKLRQAEKELESERKQQQATASDEWLKKKKEAQDKWTKYVEEQGLSEVQKAELNYNREYDSLANANAKKLISDELYVKAAEGLEEDLAKKKEEIQKKQQEKTINNVFAGLSTLQGQASQLGNLFSMYYSNKSAEVDNWQTRQLEIISSTYDAEKTNIEATITDKTQKDAALKALDEKRAREEKAIREKAEKDKRKIQREAAQKEKQINIFGTLVGIPKAAFDAYKSLAGIPIIGPALGAIAATAATAFGFAQVALIASTPLPAAAQGGIFNTAHIAGEAGPEAQIPLSGPQGQAALSSLFAGMWDAFEAKLAAKAGLADRSLATVEKTSGIGKLTVVLQDAGQTLKTYIGDVVQDGSRRGEFIVYARGTA